MALLEKIKKSLEELGYAYAEELDANGKTYFSLQFPPDKNFFAGVDIKIFLYTETKFSVFAYIRECQIPEHLVQRALSTVNICNSNTSPAKATYYSDADSRMFVFQAAMHDVADAPLALFKEKILDAAIIESVSLAKKTSELFFKRLEFESGENFISIAPVDYQFPCGGDSWLQLQIIVCDGENFFAAKDAFLEAADFSKIKEWLIAAFRGDVRQKELAFTEPNISFCCEGRTETDVLIKVNLDYECKPNFFKADGAYSAVFKIAKPALKNLIFDGCSRICENFPPRAGKEL